MCAHVYAHTLVCKGDRSGAHFTLIGAVCFCKLLLVDYLQLLSTQCGVHLPHLARPVLY